MRVHPHIVIDETALAVTRAHEKRLEVIHPFVILSLPRSRTAWLSHFLSYGDWHCGHDQIRHMRSLDDVKAWLAQPCTGTVETAGAPWWRMLQTLAPTARVVVIRRPVAEVVESFMGLPGCTFDRDLLTAAMVKHDRKLDQIEARMPCLSVRFADLETEQTCAALFEHCLPYAHDRDHWARLAPLNIQIDMRALIRYCEAYRPALDKLATIARHQAFTALALRKCEPDGMVIQTESFDDWLKDARGLFDDHLVQVGEAPGDWRGKNIPLMRAIDQMGSMQITTARSNGRMFGYLMTVIAPSLESQDILTGTNTTFYASPDVPGLGLKLQRASLGFLQARGVNEVFYMAGVRGSAERTSAIYRRLGAQNNGQVYRLDLPEAA